MGIKLDVSVDTPLSDDDRDILSGIAVTLLAIANRQDLAEQRQEKPEPCGSVQQGSDPPTYCVKEVGHSGRHKFRPLVFEGLAN